MTRAELLALADRCEREKPSRRLDFEIGQLLHGPNIVHEVPNGEWVVNRTGTHLNPHWERYIAPCLTSSVDAAATVAPYGASTISESADMADGIKWRAVIGGGMACWADTEPMARCAAALRARAALLDEGAEK